jgi:hypothetical protein
VSDRFEPHGAPEGYTDERPAPDEIGRPGSPEPAHGDDQAGHGTDEHGDGEHAEMHVGPIDRAAWVASAVGIAIGLVIALFFAMATFPR